MRIECVKIQNYRSIKDLEFEFPKTNQLVLVGANNAGKSNIVRAIDLVLGADWQSEAKLEDHDYYGRNKENKISIKIQFDNSTEYGFVWDSSKGEHVLKNLSTNRWLSNAERSSYPCTYLGADRTFDRHLSFYDWTLLGKIRKEFDRRAKKQAGLIDELNKNFQAIGSVFEKVEGFQDFKNDFGNFFREMQSENQTKLSIDFKPFTPSNYFKTLQILATDPAICDATLDLAELGEGSRNTVLLALIRSFAKNFRGESKENIGVLAIEEPEIYLHPQARRHLSSILKDISTEGMQVIVSTHSSSFLDCERFESIGRVVKVDDSGEGHKTDLVLVSREELRSHCVETGVPNEKVSVENISEYYSVTSNYRLNEAFFSKLILLVEGNTEELALPEYLKTLNIDCNALGISVLGVGGKSQIPKYWRLFSKFKIPIIILCDSDQDKGGTNNSELIKCFSLEVNDFKDVDVFKELTGQGNGNPVMYVLQDDFEKAIRIELKKENQESIITDLENEAKQFIKAKGDQGKAQIARYVAKKLPEKKTRFVPSFVKSLSSKIEKIVGVSRASS